MNPTGLFQDIFLKSPNAQIISSNGLILMANRAAVELLVRSSDVHSLTDTPMEAYFKNWEKALPGERRYCFFDFGLADRKRPLCV